MRDFGPKTGSTLATHWQYTGDTLKKYAQMTPKLSASVPFACLLLVNPAGITLWVLS
jgi:hypothetical protein